MLLLSTFPLIFYWNVCVCTDVPVRQYIGCVVGNMPSAQKDFGSWQGDSMVWGDGIASVVLFFLNLRGFVKWG